MTDSQPILWTCGHPRTPENTENIKQPRCKMCRIAKNAAAHLRMFAAPRENRLRDQDGKCALCGTTETTRWEQDHNHACCPRRGCANCLRGVLCAKCNRWISALECPGWLEAGLAYLKSYPLRSVDA